MVSGSVTYQDGGLKITAENLSDPKNVMITVRRGKHLSGFKTFNINLSWSRHIICDYLEKQACDRRQVNGFMELFNTEAMSELAVNK